MSKIFSASGFDVHTCECGCDVLCKVFPGNRQPYYLAGHEPYRYIDTSSICQRYAPDEPLATPLDVDSLTADSLSPWRSNLTNDGTAWDTSDIVNIDATGAGWEDEQVTDPMVAFTAIEEHSENGYDWYSCGDPWNCGIPFHRRVVGA